MSSAKSSLEVALREARPALTGVAAFSMLINLLMLASPLYMMQLYDRVLPSRSVPTLIALSVLFVGIVAVIGGFEFLRSRVMVRMGTGLDRRLAARVFDAIVQRDVGGAGKHRDQPLQDLTQLRTFLTGPGLFAFFDAPWVPIYVAAIFLLHPVLGGVAVVGSLALMVLALASERWTRSALEQANTSHEREATWVESSRRSAESLIAMGMTDGARERWNLERKSALDAQAIASDRSGLLAAMSRSLRLLLQSAMLGTGAALAIEGVISAGAMVAGSILLGRALAPVEQAIAHWRSLLGARRSYARLSSLVTESSSPEEALRLPAPKGVIQVEQITAGPPGATRATLQQLDFEIESGEVLGIVGRSGAGKSTLAKLLAGVWRPQRGVIRLDGTALDHWHREDLSRAVGYLPQEIELFEGTIRSNIARLEVSASDAEVLRAAKLAGAHDLISHLPDGYETDVGRDGACLSGGQRQRIALARALYGSPSLIILDEPNSSLDAEGDGALTEAIRAMKQAGCTVIVVAHRPSAIAAVDRVLVLSEGRVAALGPRDSLLREVKADADADEEAAGPAPENANVQMLRRSTA